MISETPNVTNAPATCEGCGSVLVVFEEHPDEGTIYCTCACVGEADRTNEDRPRANAADTVKISASPAKGSHRCVSCGAVLIAVGTRADGSPAVAECPCGRPQRLDQERRLMARDAPRKPRPIERPELSAPPIPSASGSRTPMVAGVVIVAVGLSLAGFWALRRGRGPAAPVAAAAQHPAAPPLKLSGDVEVRNDASGAVTLVAGADPAVVFRAFCRHRQFNAALVPGGIQPFVPPDPDRLVGSAVLMDGAGTRHQVILKRDPKTQRWSIGDGTTAITLGHSAAGGG